MVTALSSNSERFCLRMYSSARRSSVSMSVSTRIRRGSIAASAYPATAANRTATTTAAALPIIFLPPPTQRLPAETS
uniref:Uncharacterized protein n=1 Tax=Arundo donax TaxID=35708 RepID=A0A0A9ARZ0_ARUDO